MLRIPTALAIQVLDPNITDQQSCESSYWCEWIREESRQSPSFSLNTVSVFDPDECAANYGGCTHSCWENVCDGAFICRPCIVLYLCLSIFLDGGAQLISDSLQRSRDATAVCVLRRLQLQMVASALNRSSRGVAIITALNAVNALRL